MPRWAGKSVDELVEWLSDRVEEACEWEDGAAAELLKELANGTKRIEVVGSEAPAAATKSNAR